MIQLLFFSQKGGLCLFILAGATCQTQTTLRAKKALEAADGASKVLKSPQCGPYFTKFND
jgi:hypothetical protein